MIAFIMWARLVVRHNGKGTNKRKGYLGAGKKRLDLSTTLCSSKKNSKAGLGPAYVTVLNRSSQGGGQYF